MSERYTPHQIARALRGVGDDVDLNVDVCRLLIHLEPQDHMLLSLYAAGYSPHEALRVMGRRGNAQRDYDTAIRNLARLINEGVK
jgi:hypothetical protein